MTKRSAISNAETCTHSGCADGDAVVGPRAVLYAPVELTVDISAERRRDLALAADEAVTNVVEHAYGMVLAPVL